MKKYILVSLNGIGNKGGVERVSYYLNEILKKEGKIDLLIKELKNQKINTLLTPILISLRLFFKKGIVFSNSYQSFLYPNDFLITHGTTFGYLKNNPEEKTIGSLLICLMEFIANNLSKNILAVSSDTKEELEKFYKVKSKKIIVLNNFVNENMFYPLKQKRKETITILYSGRLSNAKGITKLLELAKKIEGNKKIFLKIATTNRDESNALFSKFENTKLIYGLTINEMNRFYNSGDILFFPTNYEGFSMATLEALAAGIPVIGTNQAIKKELSNYKFIHIYKNESVEEILQKIEELVKNYNGKREEIHKKIIEEFGLESYSKKLKKIL